MATFKLLLVDDYEPFRRFVRSIIEARDDFRIVGEASDGWAAVQTARELQPDLVLLDIGLPKLNGIQVARWVRDVAPGAKILFLSEESDPTIIQEGFRTGAMGYVRKLNTLRELLIAIDAVLRGKQSVSYGLEDDDSDVRAVSR